METFIAYAFCFCLFVIGILIIVYPFISKKDTLAEEYDRIDQLEREFWEELLRVKKKNEIARRKELRRFRKQFQRKRLHNKWPKSRVDYNWSEPYRKASKEIDYKIELAIKQNEKDCIYY